MTVESAIVLARNSVTLARNEKYLFCHIDVEALDCILNWHDREMESPTNFNLELLRQQFADKIKA